MDDGIQEKNIIYISPEELACIKEGNVLWNETAYKAPVWYLVNGQWFSLPEGTLARFQGSDWVYVVSFWQFHHLQMTAQDFNDVGYKPSNIVDFPYPFPSSNYNISGDDFPRDWFYLCWNWWW